MAENDTHSVRSCPAAALPPCFALVKSFAEAGQTFDYSKRDEAISASPSLWLPGPMVPPASPSAAPYGAGARMWMSAGLVPVGRSSARTREGQGAS